MIKKILTSLGIISLATILYAASGTPLTLRVNTDASNNLLVTGRTLTGTTTSSVFSNTRLNTDSSGNLLVVLAASTSPFVGPTATDCSVVTYTFTGRLTTGLNSHAANTWNLCGGGTLGLSGNTTAVTSSLPLLVPAGTVAANGIGIGNAGTGFFSSAASTVDFAEVGDGLSVMRFSNVGFDLYSTFTLRWGSSGLTTPDTAIGRGGAAGKIVLTGTTPTFILGGTTSSFPSIKRNATAINFRLADDSADAPISASTLTTSGSTIITAAASSAFNWTGQGFIGASANGKFYFEKADGTGVQIDASTAGTAFFTSTVAADTAIIRAFNANAYLTTRGSAPAVSNTTANSCGTTAATLAGNDNNGVITVGATAGTNCTITFVTAAPTRRECTSSNETTGNLSRTTYIDTTHSTVEGTFVAGDLISYVCFAR